MFQDFEREHIGVESNFWEINQGIPSVVIETCASKGYLGGTIPKEYGGLSWDYVTYGVFTEAIARGSVSLSGLFNVHTMVVETIVKWGTDQQKAHWLPLLASGSRVAALAMTEPGAGSDLSRIQTEYREGDKGFVLNGTKKWITFGAYADLFLVFGKSIDGHSMACLVDKDSPGITVTPIKEMLGFRASYLAQIEFHDVIVPYDHMIGRPGYAFTHLSPYALEFGRISIAFAALGLLRACLETCADYVRERKAFNANLIDHGMIAHMIADLGTDLEAAKLLSLDACRSKDEHCPDATEKIMMAKYFASRASSRHASNAVQMMGALGCNEHSAVSRYFRDSKTLEIVEGSNQIIQHLLGKGLVNKVKYANRSREALKENTNLYV